MLYLLGLTGFLLVLAADAKVGDSANVPFCTETDQCLLFNTTCENKCFEVRHYGSFKLVSTHEEGWIMWMALMAPFRRLYSYINGDNEDGAQIEMASPVLLKEEDKGFFKKKFTMSFVLPAEHQDRPPLPYDPDIFIEELTDVSMYVRKFPGWMTPWNVKRNLKILTSCLNDVNADFSDSYHYYAGYNSPKTTGDKHNEVWRAVVGKPKCTEK